MRRFAITLFSCTALMAFMGLSGAALAAVDPSCDGDPYDNTPAIHDFAIATPDSNVAGEVSAVEGGGLACGSVTSDTGTFYDHADVLTPPGVEVNGTSGMADNSFVGTALINVSVNAFGGLYQAIYENVASRMSIEPLLSCQNEALVGGPIAGTIIACYKGTNPQGYNYNIVTAGDDGRTWLTIGPFHPPVGTAGLTHIKQFNLCGYVGSTGGSVYPNDCGTSSDPFLQKNGAASAAGTLVSPKSPRWAMISRKPCAWGRGTYSVTATNLDGQTTDPPASACVVWTQ